MKIAIIDDDPVCHFLHGKLIERISAEYQISNYNNGLQALEYLILNASKPEMLPDLILLDINMPVMNGWQFLEKLRLALPVSYKPEIYLVSSSTDLRDAENASHFPELKGFLHKPLTKPQISQILDNTHAIAPLAYQTIGWPAPCRM